MFKRSGLILVIVLLSATQFSAQSFSIGPQIGIQKSKGSDKSTVLFGGAARLRLSPGLAVEGSINYKKEEYYNGNYKATMYPIMVTGMIYVLPIAYLAAGGGWYNVKHEFSALYRSEYLFKNETTSEFGYHFGGGGELALGSLILTADIRYVFFDLKIKNASDLKNLNTNFYVITAGILFRL